MTLAASTRIGPYEIVAPLGAGGMGEVYRARDSRLGRDVAIKALPAALAQNAERIARFEREAKLLASLSHPNIGSIYGLEDAGGQRFLVLELVEGKTLAACLEGGAFPLEEALAIARQVASALETAHESGIVHRDLKPGNVMLTAASVAKVLDFGLAKSAGDERSGSGPNLSESPTMTYAATQAGVILGTAAYMSPEQARGKGADRRADIWSFGCLLYELLSRRQAFEGETVSDMLAAILKTEPDWTALPPSTPPRVVALIRRCLRKDPSMRLRDIGDARIEIDEVLAGDAGATPSTATVALRPSRLPWLVAAAALVIVASVVSWALSRSPHSSAGALPVRFTVDAPPGTHLAAETDGFVISPDGRMIALVAIDSSGTPHLWIRDLTSLVPRLLAGTDNAFSPFWSPDSRSLGFFAENKLKTLALAGGSPEVLCDAPDGRGGSWGSRGIIVFAPTTTGGIFRIPSQGGKPSEVFHPDSTQGETALRYPRFLPDGRHFVFVTLPSRDGNFEVHLGDLDAKRRWPIARAAAVPTWAEPGYLILCRNDLLVAQRLDLGAHRLTGNPVSLGEAPITTGPSGVMAVSVSSTGVLTRSSAGLANTRMVWLDRAGQQQGVVPLPVGRWETIQISPDGRRVAMLRRVSATQSDIWLADLAGGVASRFTPAAAFSAILWSPDGRRLLYSLSPTGPEDLYTRSVDDDSPPQLLYRSNVQFKNALQWTDDGRFVVFSQPDSKTGWDAWLLPIDGQRAPVPLLRGPDNEMGAWLSPDQRSVIYLSDASGRVELYAQSYPNPGSRRRVTADPGTWSSYPIAKWSSDGRELIVAGGNVLSLTLEPGHEFDPGPARLLFRAPPDLVGFDVMPDHQRFLATLQVPDAAPPGIAVDMNWAAALRKP